MEQATLEFLGSILSIYVDKKGSIWMYGDDIGVLLGYKAPRQGVSTLLLKNKSLILPHSQIFTRRMTRKGHTVKRNIRLYFLF